MHTTDLCSGVSVLYKVATRVSDSVRAGAAANGRAVTAAPASVVFRNSRRSKGSGKQSGHCMVASFFLLFCYVSRFLTAQRPRKRSQTAGEVAISASRGTGRFAPGSSKDESRPQLQVPGSL